MTGRLLAFVAVVPGVVAAGLMTRYYGKNKVNGRYAFLPLDEALERQIARKLMKTWGEKQVKRYKVKENRQVEEVWKEVKNAAGVKLMGKVWVLESEDWVLQLFPTGDLFLSTGTIRSVKENELKSVFAHELAHILLRHPQESIHYSKIVAVLSAYLCRHNHHLTEQLKQYQLHCKYNQIQEAEANCYASSILKNQHISFTCVRAI
jgi:Zn-dependent protease with chaperone function